MNEAAETILRGIFGDNRDPMEKVVDSVNEQIEHSQEISNKLSEAMRMLEVPTTPQEKYWQAMAVGMAAALIGVYEMGKASLMELEEVKTTLAAIHTHIAHHFPVADEAEQVMEDVNNLVHDGEPQDTEAK